MTYFSIMGSPVGELLITSETSGLTGLHLGGGRPRPEWIRADDRFTDVRKQLDLYWSGSLRRFDLDLAPGGTDFQLAVWSALQEIPYGEIVTYKELADRIGKPRAIRAVGRANGANPIAIIVPCHRVIGSDGTLTGYGGGLDRKAALLAHEGAAVVT
jgi:methylated-DNA-[protein]-cysteine S-methyltransferase